MKSPWPDTDRKRQEELVDIMKEREAIIEAAEKASKKAPKGTAVDGPQHYNGYQVLDAICDASPGMARGFCLGNVVKYLLRAEKKGKDKQDLEKAKFYLVWYIKHYGKYNEEAVDS